MAVRDKVAELGLADRLTVILGEEVSTADGEVVGVFLQHHPAVSPPTRRPMPSTTRAAWSRSHPYDPFRQSHIREEPLIGLLEAGKVDMIEVFNSQVTLQRLAKAAELAARFQVPASPARTATPHSRSP